MSYWSDRQEKLNKALEKDEEKLKKRLNRIYDAEARRLERQIAAYYEMYGEDNVIDYRKLLEELPPEDKRLLIEDIDEFVKRYPDYADLVPVRESIYKLDRLEGLQQSVKMQQLRIGAQEQEMIKDHLVRTAYRGANASAEAMGFGSAFYSMNEDIMKKFVDVPWADGESFSDKIWANKEKLTNYLNKDIAQGMARGDSYANLTKQIMERMGKVSRNDAYRLIYTEGTYVMAESSITPFEEDFEYFKVCTVGDNKVCDICKGLEGAEPVPISKRVPGENFPPLHPWCRCTFTIEVEDWDAWMDDYVAKHGQSAADEAAQIAGHLGAGAGGGDGKTIRKDIGEIDPSKTKEALEYYGNIIRDLPDENAIVVTADGKVYNFIGGPEGADIFGVDLTGASITHNHPITNDIVSFGQDDFVFLREHPEIKELRAVNRDYNYSVSVIADMSEVTYTDVEEWALEFVAQGEEMQHAGFLGLKKRGYVEYERTAVNK